MATVAPTTTDISEDGSIFKFVWTPLTSTNADGSPIQFAQWADRCIQVNGTFGTGTAVWQGSNDGTNWFTLSDAQTNAISKTANALEQVVEISQYARPAVTGADGTTSLTFTLICRRANPMRT